MDSDKRQRYSATTGREQSSASASYPVNNSANKGGADAKTSNEGNSLSESKSKLSESKLSESKSKVLALNELDKAEEARTIHNDVKGLNPEEFLAEITSGKLLIVNSRRRNGLIIYKDFYAEFAGPGAAVGGLFDAGCHRVVPVGDLSLLHPVSYEERQKAYLIRRQWIRLTQKFTDNSVALQRAQMILNQFENYFDTEAIACLPDEAFALLVGVLPQTVQIVRRGYGNPKDRF